MLQQMGKTVIVATHDPLFENLSFASSVVYMEDGMVVKRHQRQPQDAQ